MSIIAIGMEPDFTIFPVTTRTGYWGYAYTYC